MLPVTFLLTEIDTENVGMFFVHLIRWYMLQSYDPSKKNTNILESSTTTMHDSLANALPDTFQTKLPIEILTSLAFTHNNYCWLCCCFRI